MKKKVRSMRKIVDTSGYTPKSLKWASRTAKSCEAGVRGGSAGGVGGVDGEGGGCSQKRPSFLHEKGGGGGCGGAGSGGGNVGNECDGGGLVVRLAIRVISDVNVERSCGGMSSRTTRWHMPSPPLLGGGGNGGGGGGSGGAGGAGDGGGGYRLGGRGDGGGGGGGPGGGGGDGLGGGASSEQNKPKKPDVAQLLGYGGKGGGDGGAGEEGGGGGDGGGLYIRIPQLRSGRAPPINQQSTGLKCHVAAVRVWLGELIAICSNRAARKSSALPAVVTHSIEGQRDVIVRAG
eukprot:4822032-Prymnesium_polylepis.3